MPEIILLPTFSDYRGKLTVLEKVLPFEIKRIYYIYDVPSPSIDRGGHYHRKTRQALICVSGSCIISTNDGGKKTEFKLDSADKCLILEPSDWHTMHHFTEGAVLLVLASEYFEADDYIDEEHS